MPLGPPFCRCLFAIVACTTHCIPTPFCVSGADICWSCHRCGCTIHSLLISPKIMLQLYKCILPCTFFPCWHSTYSLLLASKWWCLHDLLCIMGNTVHVSFSFPLSCTWHELDESTSFPIDFKVTNGIRNSIARRTNKVLSQKLKIQQPRL